MIENLHEMQIKQNDAISNLNIMVTQVHSPKKSATSMQI